MRFLNEATVAVAAVEDPSDAASTWSLYKVRVEDGVRGGLTCQSGIWGHNIVPLSPEEILFQRSRPASNSTLLKALRSEECRGCFFNVYGELEGVYVINRQTGACNR